MSNLRQIGLAALNYANENGGRLVYAKRDDKTVAGSFGMWYWDLSPYMDGERGNNGSPVYTCPTYARKVRTGELSDVGFQVWKYGFGMNMQPNAQASGAGRGTRFNSRNIDAEGLRGKNSGDFKLSQVQPAYAIPLFAECAGWNINFGRSLTAEEPDGRRDGKFNVLFADLHVEALDVEEAKLAFDDPMKRMEQDNE